MKFKLNESRSDIHLLVRELQTTELAVKGDPEIRALLTRAAYMLNECESLLLSQVQSLEEAVSLRAGIMDSLSRHEEITRAKNIAMETAAQFSRSLLQQYTPRPTDNLPKSKNYEVI